MTRCAALSLVASFALLASAEDGVLPEATVEELDEAGLVLHKAADIDALQLNLDILVDQKIARLEQLEERLGELELFKEMANVAQMRELLEIADLEIVEWMPDATGQSEIENPLDSAGGLPDHGMLGAKMPSGDSLVSDGWERTHVADDGTETWELDHTDSDGTNTHKSMLIKNGDEVIASSWVVTRTDGTMSSSTSTETKDGGTHTVNREYEGGEVVEETHHYEPPAEDTGDAEGAGDAGEGTDVDGYQPAEGSEGGGYCPLYLAACQLMAEEIEKDKEDPYRLIGGGALVLPPDGEAKHVAARLAIDPQTLVINPDPNVVSGGSSGKPPKVRYELPVIVLPPKPGT